MGCLVRLLGGASVIVFALGLIFMVMKWIAPGFEIGWGAIIGMMIGGAVAFGICFAIVENE